MEGRCLKVLKGHTDYVKSAEFNYDGSMIVSSSNYEIRIWEAQTGECLSVIECQR